MTSKIVIVAWIDAHTTELEEIAPESVSESLHYGYPTTSIGLLIRSDETGVSLCSDRQEGNDGSIHYRCAHFIPRGMVTSEMTVDEPSRKPKTKRKPRRAKSHVDSTTSVPTGTAV
jgi:hypothetical protein